MSHKLSSIRRRLVKAQQQMAEIARREELSNCNCRTLTVASDQKPDEFEREMNIPCPTHGLRRLGHIIQVVSVDAPAPEVVTTGPQGELLPLDEPLEKLPPEVLDRLLDLYHARLAEDDRLKREKQEQEDDDEE